MAKDFPGAFAGHLGSDRLCHILTVHVGHDHQVMLTGIAVAPLQSLDVHLLPVARKVSEIIRQGFVYMMQTTAVASVFCQR